MILIEKLSDTLFTDKERAEVFSCSAKGSENTILAILLAFTDNVELK